MPPDHPYPAALDDCIAVYRRLLEMRPPERIVVGGGSAGGNLAAALDAAGPRRGSPDARRARAADARSPTSPSRATPSPPTSASTPCSRRAWPVIALYADGHDLTHPYLSPLFGDLHPAFPPTLLQSGTRDLFLSNTVRLHRKLRAAGVDAELHVFEAMPHGGFFGAPEDDEIGAEVRRFLARAPRPLTGTR